MLNLLTLACLLAPSQERVGSSDVAAMLPPTTAVVVEIAKPSELIKAVVEHPVHDRAKEDKNLGPMYRGPGLAFLKGMIAAAEITVKMKWPEAVETLAGNGITFAFDPETKGAVAVLKSAKPDKLEPMLDRVVKYANEQREKNNQEPIEEDQYRGVAVYKYDNVAWAVLPDSILITTQKNLGKWVLDAHFVKPAESLASNNRYKEAKASMKSSDAVAGFLDMQIIRDRGGIENLLTGVKSNVFAEFLLGGILESLSDSSFITAGLNVTDDGIKLTARTPHKPGEISEPREYYFGPEGSGRAPAAIKTDGSIGSIAVYRDVSKMWLYAGDLFDQNINDGFAEAESNLSTLFAGKDFAEEILAEIKPEWQLVFARQDFKNILPKPAVKFPSFALVGEFKDAKKMNSEMKRIFQSMVGFFNVIGAMEGNPQLEQDMDKADGVTFLTASFVPTPEDAESEEATIHYNFAPTLALGENRFALSSSLALAKSAMAAKAGKAANEPANVDLNVQAKALQAVLTDNKEQLISNNMLEEGNSRRQAETNINILLGVVGWFEDFTATLSPSSEQLELKLELSVRK